MASTSDEESSQTKITTYERKDGTEYRRGVKRSRSPENTIDTGTKKKKVQCEQLTHASAQKIRRCQPQSTKHEDLPVPSTSFTDIVEKNSRGVKRSRSPDDVPDTEAQKSRRSQRLSNIKAVPPSADATETIEISEKKGKEKYGKKRLRSDDEQSGAPAPKKIKKTLVLKKKVKEKFKNFRTFVTKLRKEMVCAVNEICEETKEAVSNPSELAKEIGKYKHEIEQKFSEFTDDGFHRARLREHEEDILKGVASRRVLKDVKVEEETDGNEVIIHTVCYEPTNDDEPSKFPLVLIHGYAGGLACFHKNFSSLCEKRKVYAIDLPGFALSSRVTFPNLPQKCRDRMVELIEKWRDAVGLEKFIILGHSFGGYLAASYTLKHKERVRHLILADSWGVLGKGEDKREPNPVAKALIKLNLNPYEFIRQANILGKVVHDMFVPKKITAAYGNKMIPYFYHSNAQANPTGEEAFANISDDYLWPHDPLKAYLAELDSSVPITFLYGKESDFKNEGGKDVQVKRKNVFLPDVLNAGHHIQAEDHEVFNKRVNEVCDMVDGKTDKEPEAV